MARPDGNDVTYNLNQIAGTAQSYRTLRDADQPDMDALDKVKLGFFKGGPISPHVRGDSMRVTLLWEKGLRLLSNPTVHLFDGEAQKCEMYPVVSGKPARTPCGDAAQIDAGDAQYGGTCIQKWEYFVGTGMLFEAAEAQVASQFPPCAGCVAVATDAPPASPSPPPNAPFVNSYVANIPTPAASGTFELSLSGGADYWSGIVVNLNTAASNTAAFAYTSEPGRRKTYEITANLVKTEWLNEATLAVDSTYAGACTPSTSWWRRRSAGAGARDDGGLRGQPAPLRLGGRRRAVRDDRQRRRHLLGEGVAGIETPVLPPLLPWLGVEAVRQEAGLAGAGSRPPRRT